MEWTVDRAANPDEEAKNATYPQIRMFNLQKSLSAQPESDCQGQWLVCSPETASKFSAVGYFYARQLNKEGKFPVGMINTSWGGTICEAWTSKPALEADADLKYLAEKNVTIDLKRMNPNQPSVLFNAMLNPIVPYGIKGAIWYQGESNRGRAEQYRKLFPTMITDWRKQFGQGDFPFYFVELAPFRYNNNDPRELPEVWEAQTATLALTNTGMCVTTDIGNIKDIHPKNKQEVGRRLALWALAKDYGQKDLPYSGPLYDSMAIEGTKIRLKFTHVNGGLVAEGGKPLSYFTIAGEDENFVEATATIDGDTVVVQSDMVPKPVAVRFAWLDTAEPNFFNKAGLPASPFRTDSFKMVTAGKK
jgi:sialate O-acetylesterase